MYYYIVYEYVCHLIYIVYVQLICVCTSYMCMYRYQREFGFTIPSRDIRVDDIRVRAMGRACSHNPTPIATPTSDPPIPTKVSQLEF